MSGLFDLSNRVAVVTGSTEGMGYAMARALGANGAKIVVSGRSQARSEEVAARLQNEGITARGVACDVTDRDSVAHFATASLQCFGRVDALILNAAGPTPIGAMLSQSAEQLDDVVGKNLRSSLLLVNALAPQMMERRDGAIIFMSSRAAKRGSSMLGLYAMSKAAIDQYVRNLALELGPHGINVNSINPGPVRTEFSREALWSDAEKEAKLAATIPLRRLGAAEDVAGLAVLLSGPAGRFIHGQNISVDGGLTA